MRTPEFQAYVAPARLYPQIWRLLLGVLLIILVYAGFVVLEFGAVFLLSEITDIYISFDEILSAQNPLSTLILLSTFIGMALGPIIAAPACHYRSPGTLFGPFGTTVRGFFTAVVVVFVIYSIYAITFLYFEAPQPKLDLMQWLKYLPLAIPLLFIQTTAEELIFRGYLQQQLAARFNSRIIWMVLPSILFASLHWDPEMGDMVWLIIAATFVMAMIAADLTEKTGSLGAAMGLHFANNFFAMLIISIEDSINGLALYIAPFDKSDTSTVVLAVGIDVILLLIVWRVLRIALDR